MKPYKGLVKISCKTKDTCARKVQVNVQPLCMVLNCPEALIEILDLDGKVLASVKPKPSRKQAKDNKWGCGDETPLVSVLK